MVVGLRVKLNVFVGVSGGVIVGEMVGVSVVEIEWVKVNVGVGVSGGVIVIDFVSDKLMETEGIFVCELVSDSEKLGDSVRVSVAGKDGEYDIVSVYVADAENVCVALLNVNVAVGVGCFVKDTLYVWVSVTDSVGGLE